MPNVTQTSFTKDTAGWEALAKTTRKRSIAIDGDNINGANIILAYIDDTGAVRGIQDGVVFTLPYYREITFNADLVVIVTLAEPVNTNVMITYA